MKVTLGLEMLLKGKYCLVGEDGVDLNVSIPNTILQFLNYHISKKIR